MSSFGTDLLAPRVPHKKAKKGVTRAPCSGGDFLIKSNSSSWEQLWESANLAALMAAFAPAAYTRLVEGLRLRIDSSKSLTTSLMALACALNFWSLANS
jgi:hypothetical protein